jgi:pilus assembly protein CpaF
VDALWTRGCSSCGRSGYEVSTGTAPGAARVQDLYELVLERADLADLDPAQRRLALREMASDRVPQEDLGHCVAQLSDAIDGFGPLTPLMRDPFVTDVLVNGTESVWIDRPGGLAKTSVAFSSPAELLSLADRLLGRAGARADASRPIGDARLQDGSRFHVVLPPIAPNGALVSIRKFPRTRPSVEDLVHGGMLDSAQASLLAALVKDRRSIAISGATGTGKTTLLNALLGGVPETERVVLVEELPELQPSCAHAVSLVARPPNVENAGEVDLATLVRAALRMRPDRIVVGEIRGDEALAALGAMSTGHEGSMVTLHARDPDEALERFVTLALQARAGTSEAALQRQVTRALDVVVQLDRDAGGGRVVTAIEDVE